MDRLIQLGTDMVSLWNTYGGSYLNGIKNTLILALAATLIGCLIGFICGILQTIPCSRKDSAVKRFFPGSDPGDREDLCGSVPWYAHGAAGGIRLLRPSVFYQ